MAAPFMEGAYSHDRVDVFPAGEPGTFQFIPRVEPELTPAGDPTLTLMKTREGGIAQFGAELTVNARLRDKLRASLAERAATPVRLEPAPVQVRRARLVMNTESGESSLAEVAPSGFGSNTALFSVPLSKDQMDAFERAVGGKKGLFRVSYDFDLTRSATATVRIEGDASEVLRAFPESPSRADAGGWIERALAGGTLRITVEESGPEPESVTAAAKTAAKERAAALLAAMQGAPVHGETEQSSRILSEIRLEEPRLIRMQRELDVAEWFEKKRAPAVLSAESASPNPPEAMVTIRAGFDDKDAPLAFVEVQGVGRPAILRGPSWQPVRVKSSGAVTITARYTRGEPEFVHEVETSGGERSLRLEDLGIFKILIDATARKSKGSKLNVELTYVRDGVVTATWSSQFAYGDWSEPWFVITRSDSLNGYIEYRWKETAADGSVVTGGPLKTDRPAIRIE